MAAANPLEDQITCSVCFEVYRDPHVLRECLHTFCLQCIQQLEQRGKISCPECREVTARRDVKKDFKTQSLIDALKQQTEPEITDRSSKCATCPEGVNKPVQYFCPKCEHLFCGDCNNVHKKMEATKDHKVRTVGEILKATEKNLREILQNVEKEGRNIDTKSVNIDKLINKIEECEATQLGQVKQFTKDAIKDLEENEKHLQKIIKDANAACVRTLRQKNKSLSKSKQEIQTKVKFLKEMIAGQDLSACMESAENIKQSMDESIRNIRSSLPDIQSNITSPVSVSEGVNWNVKGCIEVKVGEVSYGSEEIKPVLTSLYSDLLKKQYVQKECIKTGHWPIKLCNINSNIWCCGLNMITVYNQDGVKINTIKHSKLGRYIWGITLTHNNHVIVACENGLHQLDTTGSYQSCITGGNFLDVHSHGDKIYALKYSKGEILTFMYDNKWVQINTCRLKYDNRSELDKVCVHEQSIYVSSENNKCIFVYDLQGHLQREIRQGKNNIHLCGVDQTGHILVTDCNNKHIKVIDPEGTFHVVPLNNVDINYPIHALVDDQQNLWVANWRNGTLVKCT